MRSLRTQLLISHLLLVLVMGAVMSLSITSLFSLARTVQRLSQNNLRSVVAAYDIQDALQHVFASAELTRSLPANATASYQAAHADLISRMHAGDLAADSDNDRALMQAIRRSANRLDSQFGALQAAKTPRESDAALAMLSITLGQASENARSLGYTNYEATQRDNKHAADEATRSSWWSVGYTAAALIVAILLAGRMMGLALRPLALLAKQAEVIGSGDLDRKIQLDRNDEIGALADSFNEMATKLADLRKMEERRLRRAQKMTDAALESLYDPVIIADAKGRIVHLNRAAEQLFGPAPESPRAPVIEHIGDQRIYKAIIKAIQQQSVSATEDETAIVPIKVEGGDRTFRLRGTPMKEDDGTLLGSVVVLEDITNLRQLDRLKTEFIGVASHELRTPITSLLLANELMSEGAAGPLSPEQKQIVDAQSQDLQRLEKLTRELLDLTRMEAGTTLPNFEMIPADQVARGAVQSISRQADEKGVHLVEEEAEGLPAVRVDKSQITRVLVNLLNNAIRHTPKGGTVTVRAIPSPDQVTFEVADTGEGIPAEYMAKIFDRFVQVPGATQGGAGLGLSIAQRIVKAHGGVMQLRSEVGKGSTFSFSVTTRPEGDGEAI
jgi:NtrC-family two-component system sensor histidine kinase KinB